jgi:hypothetical protein
MPVNRWAPAVSVLALCLGLVLIVGSRSAPPAAVLPRVVAALTTSPAPNATVAPGKPTATPVPPISPGYRIKIARLAIDLPLAEGASSATPTSTRTRGAGCSSLLWNAREGEEVVITTPGARELHHVVREVHPSVDPTDVSWAAPTSGERLTLQTSTGPTPGDPLHARDADSLATVRLPSGLPAAPRAPDDPLVGRTDKRWHRTCSLPRY